MRKKRLPVLRLPLAEDLLLGALFEYRKCRATKRDLVRSAFKYLLSIGHKTVLRKEPSQARRSVLDMIQKQAVRAIKGHLRL